MARLGKSIDYSVWANTSAAYYQQRIARRVDTGYVHPDLAECPFVCNGLYPSDWLESLPHTFFASVTYQSFQDRDKYSCQLAVLFDILPFRALSLSVSTLIGTELP